MLRSPHLAERKRQLVRDELSDAALQLIAYQGFDETTIDQIAAAAGVSRRTFFRYFQSKEDVIVALLAELGSGVLAELCARPAGEPVATALRRAFDVFVATFDEHPDKTRRLVALVLGTPALAARYFERQHQWRGEFAAEVGRRTGADPVADPRPALAGAVALAAFDTALVRWIDAAETDLGALVDEAFVHVGPAITL